MSIARPVLCGAVVLLALIVGCGGEEVVTTAPVQPAGVEPAGGDATEATPAANAENTASPEAAPEATTEAAPEAAATAQAAATPTASAGSASAPAATTAAAKPAAEASSTAEATSTTAATTGSTSQAVPETAPAVKAADYALDPSSSLLYVQVFKDPDTTAAALSHDHVVKAVGWTGTVHWKADDPSACQVSITVPVSGLKNDEDAMRKKVGYDNTLDEGQRADIKEHMLGKDQLNASAFPDIRFESKSCASAGGDKVKVTGDMTMHGVSKSISVTMAVSADDQRFSATGTFDLKATDFGFKPFTALLGALKNKDAMKFTVNVKGAAR